jgi:predicted metalloendopeptidase
MIPDLPDDFILREPKDMYVAYDYAPDIVEYMDEFYKTLFKFLQENNLTTREIHSESMVVDDNTCLKVGDLTKEGFEFYILAVDRWSASHDRGQPVTNIRILEKYLKKVRDSKNQG